MADYTKHFTHTATGLTLSAFPVDVTLASWTTYRAACTEDSTPNLYRYSVTITDDFYDWAVLAAGASQPSDWSNDTGIRLVPKTTINILPTTGTVPDRVSGTTINVFKDEEPTITVTLEDVDLSTTDIEFVIEDMDTADVTVVSDPDVLGFDGYYEVTIPASVTDDIKTFRYALRDITGATNLVISHGILNVTYAASDDP